MQLIRVAMEAAGRRKVDHDLFEKWGNMNETTTEPTSEAGAESATAFELHENSTVAGMLAKARDKLLDSGTRNRLIHINRKNTRAKAINIVNERTEDVFRILKTDGKTMQFEATGRDKPATDEKDAPSIAPISARGDADFDEARFTDDKLETRFGPEAQQRKLLSIFRDAKTAIEEQGVDILFLALGFLKWVESKASKIEREAPLILLPVQLNRNARTGGYDIRVRDDEIVTNLSLQKRLLEDFGIELPEIDPEDFDPLTYLDAVTDAVSAKPEWSIDRDGMQLGFFSFAKLLMRRDLDPETWENGTLGQSGPLAAMLTRQYVAQGPAIPQGQSLDMALSSRDMLHVLEADASQARVIQEVREGRDLVVQGPPGTGKSQTITNIIAAAVLDGRTVLFVAEKMAALSVVHDRLVKSGLRDVCLELHSRSSNKKAVLLELKRTLAEGRSVPDAADMPDALPETRNQLNHWAELLHKSTGPSGLTPYQLLGRLSTYMGRNMRPPPKVVGLASLSADAIGEIESDLALIADRVADPRVLTNHPFRGARNYTLSTVDRPRMVEELRAALTDMKSVSDLAEKVSTLVEFSGDVDFDGIADMSAALRLLQTVPDGHGAAVHVYLQTPISAQLRSALERATDMQEKREKLRGRLQPMAETVPLAHLRSPLQRGVGSWFARLMPAYRNAKRELEGLLTEAGKKSPTVLARTLDDTLALQQAMDITRRDGVTLSGGLGEAFAGLETDFRTQDELIRIAARLQNLNCTPANALLTGLTTRKAEIDKAADALQAMSEKAQDSLTCVTERLSIELSPYGGTTVRGTALAIIRDILAAMAEDPERYVVWAEVGRARERLAQHGLSELVERALSADESATDLRDQFRYAHAEAVWTAARDADPKLRSLLGASRSKAVKQFAELEETWRETAKRMVRANHLQQLPNGAAGEMGVLRGEMAKKTRHMPIRKLMQRAGSMIQKIKPVLLMSPISVAQYLPPGKLEFDLLLIDEASQVRPEDALGVVARCKQIVVVGDQKQLPPTSFFDRITGNSEYDEDSEVDGLADATDMESILTLCEASGLRQEMLEWHYRSRDPSLITVSNAEFYESGLKLPPSPLQDDPEYGMSFTRVPGVYSSTSSGGGRPGTNRIEAEAVSDAVAEHARRYPEMSLGIVAFSVKQRDMITEVLEAVRREDTVLDAFLSETGSESLFVKNIENVQGDERDVIFISVGYGPHEPSARLARMSFGPINSKGGARRLNVLFSRARSRCRVFCSFDPHDIDTQRSSAEGVRILKRFLTYARDGELVEKAPTGLGADSELEVDIANVIRDLGYSVDYQVGTAGFRIDLGVRHPERPGRYMLAVEADGATYHSALWARERDRLRQGVLEHLGWRFHRIWSTDWFQTRGREIERLKQALDEATQCDAAPVAPKTASKTKPLPQPEPMELGKQTALDLPSISAQPYRTFPDRQTRYGHPENEVSGSLTDLVIDIVKMEGPVHAMVVARRVALSFGLNSTGRKIQAATNDALRRATRRRDGGLLQHSSFYMTHAQADEPPVRDRSNADSLACKPEHLPPEELRAADAKVIEENGSMPRPERIQQIARLLGFKRVGSSLRETIDNAIGR